MALRGVAAPSVNPCDDAGGAIGAHSIGTDAMVPPWSGKQWGINHLVRDRLTPNDPWQFYFATVDHMAGQGSPSSGAPGWQQLPDTPSNIPVWAGGTQYHIDQPVRIDSPTGTHIYIATQPLGMSLNSPDTAAGATDGWRELTVEPPVQFYDSTVTVTWPAPDLHAQLLVDTATDKLVAYTDDGINWTALTMATNVTTTNTLGETPTTNPPTRPQTGDVFWNAADLLLWIYGDDPLNPGTNAWVPVSSAPTVTTTDTTGETPSTIATPPVNPKDGDSFVNTTDGKLWIWGLDPAGVGGKMWVEASQKSVVVTVAKTAGDNPGANPPAQTPRIGDWYINSVDATNWVYAVGGGGTTAPAAGWQPATPATGNVFVTDTAGSVPILSIPAVAGEALWTPPAGTTLTVGDRFVNRTDHTQWVWAPDPNNPTNNIWIPLPANNTATISARTGQVPGPAGPGQTTYTFTTPPKIGDIFINRPDQEAWVYAANPSGAGNVWEPLPDRPTVMWTSAPGAVPPPTDIYRLTGGRPLYVDSSVGFSERDKWLAHDGSSQFDSSPLCVVTAPVYTNGVITGGTITVYQDGVGTQQLGSGPRTGTTTVYDLITQTVPGFGGVIYQMHSWDEGLSAAAYGLLNPDGSVSAVHADGHGGRAYLQFVPQGSPAGTAPMHSAPIDPTILAALHQEHTHPKRDDVFINHQDGLAWHYTGRTWVPLPAGLPGGGDEGDRLVRIAGGVAWRKSSELLHVKMNFLQGDDLLPADLFDPDKFQPGRWAYVAEDVVLQASDVPAGMTIHPADGTFNYQFPLTLPAGTWLERFPNDVAAWEPASASSLRPDVTVVTAAGLTPAGAASTTTTVGTWRAENSARGGTPSPGDAYLSVMPVGDSSIHFHVTDVNGKDCTAELAAIKVGDTLTFEDGYSQPMPIDGYVMTVSSIQGTTFSGPITTHGNPTVNQQLTLTVDSHQVPTAGQKNDEYINTADNRHWIHDGLQWVEITSLPPSTTAGMILTSQAGAPPAWSPPTTSQVMLGTIAASTTEPHEYVWGQLGHTHPGGPPDWTIFPPGSYLIIDHFNTAGTIDSDIPGIGGQTADVGDWVVAIDGDGDGTSDTFHLVRHDTRTGLPATAGQRTGDVLAISNPSSGALRWDRPVGLPAGGLNGEVVTKVGSTPTWAFPRHYERIVHQVYSSRSSGTRLTIPLDDNTYGRWEGNVELQRSGVTIGLNTYGTGWYHYKMLGWASDSNAIRGEAMPLSGSQRGLITYGGVGNHDPYPVNIHFVIDSYLSGYKHGFLNLTNSHWMYWGSIYMASDTTELHIDMAGGPAGQCNMVGTVEALRKP